LQQKTTTYSLFFHDLTLRGHQLTFHQAEGGDFELKHYGEKLYDNVIMFAPTTEKFQSITFSDLSEFVEEGGNILITATKESGEELREFVEGFGATFDKKGSEVIDHFEVEQSLDKTYVDFSLFVIQII
jgi:oligosaccharyltransferase complex subunit beta